MDANTFMQQQGYEPNDFNSTEFDGSFDPNRDLPLFTMGLVESQNYPRESGHLQAQGEFRGSAQMREHPQGSPDVSQDPQKYFLHQGTSYAPSPLQQHMGQFPSQLKFELSALSSRVETQFYVNFTLSNAQTGVERVHLPRHLISNARFLAKKPEAGNLQTLQMRTLLVSADAMESPKIKLETLKEAATGSQTSAREVRICQGCINREKKRASRKANKDNAPWDGDEGKRAVLLSSEEYSTWERCQAENGHVDLRLKMPVRIACYCRHHHTKTGFCIIFTLVDHEGRWVAQGMTPPIYITDNHKDTPIKGRGSEEKSTGGSKVHKRSQPRGPTATAGPKERRATGGRPVRRERRAHRRCDQDPYESRVQGLQAMPPMYPNNPPPRLAAALDPECPPANSADLNADIGQTLAFDEPGFSSNNALALGSSGCSPTGMQQAFSQEMPPMQQFDYPYDSANTHTQRETAQNMALYSNHAMSYSHYARQSLPNVVYTSQENHASPFGMDRSQMAGANSLNAPDTGSIYVFSSHPWNGNSLNASGMSSSGDMAYSTNVNAGLYRNDGMGSPNMATDTGYYRTDGGVDSTTFTNPEPYNHGGMDFLNMAADTGSWDFGGMISNNPDAGLLENGAMDQSNMAADLSWENDAMDPFNNFASMSQVGKADFVNAPGNTLPSGATMGSLNSPEVELSGTVDPNLLNTVEEDQSRHFDADVEEGSAGLNDYDFKSYFGD